MGLEKDLPPGEQLVTLFRPFLEHLAASDLSPKTIQKYIDNMWALGGEFIRDLHNDPSLRRRPVDLVLSRMIEYGGPLLCQNPKRTLDEQSAVTLDLMATAEFYLYCRGGGILSSNETAVLRAAVRKDVRKTVGGNEGALAPCKIGICRCLSPPNLSAWNRCGRPIRRSCERSSTRSCRLEFHRCRCSPHWRGYRASSTASVRQACWIAVRCRFAIGRS
jgi:hypothetical protein